MALDANNVSLSTNFNVDPYYDDFDETKNFHRILFRPGLAVQARELTQMQTILQNQIDRFAENIFKEGSTVKGMEMYYDTDYYYLKLRDKNSTSNTVVVTNFQNKIIKGQTSGVLATVINTNDGSEANSAGSGTKTLFVKYLAANNSTGYRYFANNEIIRTVAATGSILYANTITSAQGGAAGIGTAATFNAGVIYAKDHFIRVPAQTVVISKYSTTGSARVGFDVAETIVTEVDDGTLLDPASGAYNYAAPGAARLKLTAPIIAVDLTATVSNTFVELMQVKNGSIQSTSTKTEYAKIRDYIASRTYDESGDYVVEGFNISVKEHLKTGNNQGIYTSAQGGNTSQLVVFAEPGKAYVHGYDVDRIVSTNRTIDKGIDYQVIADSKTLADYGNYVIVRNVCGQWDLNQQGVVSLRTLQANAVFTKVYSSTNFPGNEVGKARVRGVEYYSGTPGTPGAFYKLYLTDIKLNTGYTFKNVQSIGYNGGTGTVLGKADIVSSPAATMVSANYDTALFRLPATAIRKLRSSSDAVRNDFTFYKSFDITFNSAGTYSLSTGAADETYDGSAGVALSSDGQRSDFYVVSRGNANTSTLTGTVSITSGANTVTQGSSTPNFTGQVAVGDIINIGLAGDFIVSAVGATTLSVLNNAGSTVTNSAYFKKFKGGQILDFAGYGRNGARAITPSGTPLNTAVLNLNETIAGAGTLDATVIVKLNKLLSQEETKTVQRGRLVQINVNNGGGTSYVANTSGPWPLGFSDGFKLVSVRKKSGSNFVTTTDGSDVTSQFVLDSGMEDSFYDHAKLVKIPSSSLTINANDRLLVKLDYLAHGTSGRGFFSVDSYPVNDATAGTDTAKIFTYEIPVYTSKTSGVSYDLRDSVDFRPRKTDSANSVTSLTNISINPKVANTFVLPSGGLHFTPPNEDFTTDLSYYQPRIDIVSLTAKGNLNITRGVSGQRPVPPTVPDDVMAMAMIGVSPYPSIPAVMARRYGRPDQAIGLKKLSNRRYTMKDIGQIAQRIDRLEYYTSLNLLEKSASDMLVQDNAGADRFKNGILVDSFTSHAVGNVFDLDYKIAIDPEIGQMRPRFTNDETPLHYTSNSTYVVRTNVTPAGVSKDQRVTFTTTPGTNSFKAGATVTSGSYTATIRHKVGARIYIENATGNFVASATVTSSDGGGTLTISAVQTQSPGLLVTLPYSHKILVNQPYASTTRNGSGASYSYRGTITLTPDSDYWCDTVQGPDTNIQIDQNTDAWEYLASTWPATWNAPITSFTGAPVLTNAVTVDTAYQTNYTGNQIVTTASTRTTSTYATPTITTQTGNQTGVKVNTNTQSYGNIVKDTSIVPYMRSRMILFKIEGMRPSSTLYAFFDDTYVSAYVTPLTEAEYLSGLKDANGNPIKPASAEGSAMVVGSGGFIYGVFRLPNDAALKFKTGTKRLRFVDNATNSTTKGQYTTAAEGQYTAEGLSSTVSALSTTTKSVEITQTALSKSSTGQAISTTVATGSRLVSVVEDPPQPEQDPLAQTFLITGRQIAQIQTSGMYLTKMDLYFKTKSATLGVEIQLREVDPASGAITRRLLPYGRVTLQPNDVNISDDATLPTPVYFPAPVYLSDETEYAVLVAPIATNPDYQVHTAVIGMNDYTGIGAARALKGEGARISEQPASGVLYYSSNDRIYEPVVDEDLKYTAYYAEFDTSNVGQLIVKNPNRDTFNIANTTGALSRTGEVIHGETRIVGNFATTSGTWTGAAAAANGNISIGRHVTNGSAYVVGVTSGATGKIVKFATDAIRVREVSAGTPFRGGEQVRVKIANNAYRNATNGQLILTSSATTSATYPTGRVYLYDNTNYANTRLVVANVSYINTGPAFANARLFLAGTYIKGQTNGYSGRIVSIINLAMDNVNLITNMIQPSNNQVRAYAKMATSTSTRDASFFKLNMNGDNEFSAPRYILSRSNESNTAATSATMATNRSVEIMYQLDSRNKVASPAIDLSRITLYSTHNLISSTTAVGTTEDYVQFGGSSEARYITRIVTLADGQDAEDLRVYLTVYKPSGSDILVYMKALNGSDSDTMDQARWIPMTLNTDQGFNSGTRYSSSENKNDFIELVYDVPDYAASSGSPYKFGSNTSSGIYKYLNTAKAKFETFKYFQIKIVLVNSTSTNPPRVRDLRAIALQV
jgi:hypothetical protein